MVRVVKKLPATTAALLVAVAVCIAMWIDVFGAGDPFQAVPRWLRFPIMPGGFCFYVIGTLTGSSELAYAAFIMGTLIVYVGTGLLLDTAVWLVRRMRAPGGDRAGDPA